MRVPDYILRRYVEPRGMRLLPIKVEVKAFEKIPTGKVENIFARIRREPGMALPKSDKRACDYQRALMQYIRNKMLASRAEKNPAYSLVEEMHYKGKAKEWRDIMDLIEYDCRYTMPF